jgi:hypothetical protein
VTNLYRHFRASKPRFSRALAAAAALAACAAAVCGAAADASSAEAHGAKEKRNWHMRIDPALPADFPPNATVLAGNRPPARLPGVMTLSFCELAPSYPIEVAPYHGRQFERGGVELAPYGLVTAGADRFELEPFSLGPTQTVAKPSPFAHVPVSYRFELARDDETKWRVACERMPLPRLDLVGTTAPAADEFDDALQCELGDANGGTPWRLALTYSTLGKGSRWTQVLIPKLGLLARGATVYRISMAQQKKALLGFLFARDDRWVGAAEAWTGTFRVDPALDEEQRSLLVAASAALLFQWGDPCIRLLGVPPPPTKKDKSAP